MKFPSLSLLIRDFKKVVSIYPFEVFSAFCGSCATTALIELEHNNAEAASWCIRLMMAANISLLLTLSATLFSTSRNLNRAQKLSLSILAIAVSILFLFAFDPLRRESDYSRFFLVSFGFHLLVSFAAFTRGTKINEFWHFNETIFLRILAAALYSGVLYAGLAAALGATNFLFNFDFEWDTFAIMAVWIFGMFQTVFFLSGIPDLTPLEKEQSYPQGLKLFTQYVLIPLASIYVLILLSYELKILLQWSMPKGLVSSLILGYAVFGILSFLLVYPLRNQEGHKWIRTYSKTFFYLLPPLLVLLYLAIFVRVEKYGITEGRYFLISLAVWLSIVTLYFISSRKQNITVIPISLCVVTLLAVYGPLSAFNIAEQSQRSRLTKMLNENKFLEKGKLRRLDTKRDTANIDDISESARYLVNKYGLQSLQPLVKEDLDQVTDSIKTALRKKNKSRRSYDRWDLQNAQENWLGTHYNLPLDYRYNTKSLDYWSVFAENNELLPLANADAMIDLSFFRDTEDKIMLPKGRALSYQFDNTILNIKIGNDSTTFNLAKIINQPRLKELIKQQTAKDVSDDNINLPRELLTQHLQLSGCDLQLLVNHLRYSMTDNKIDIQSINAALLIKYK